MTGSELAKFDPDNSAFPALFATEGEGGVAQIMQDNLDGELSPADLDRLTVPSGGGEYWQIPDESPQKTIDGVLIHKQPTRSYWIKKRGEDGEEDGPPDCYSTDGKVGEGLFGKGSADNPTGACDVCPMAQWGTSTTGSKEGKACKEQMQLFLLGEGAVLPTQVSLPPTSLRDFKKYMTRLASRGKSYMAVVTSLALEVTKSNGQTYSVVKPSKVADLEPAEAQAARGYGQMIRGLLEQAAADRARASEVSQNASESGGGSGGPVADANGDVWSSGGEEEPAAKK